MKKLFVLMIASLFSVVALANDPAPAAAEHAAPAAAEHAAPAAAEHHPMKTEKHAKKAKKAKKAKTEAPVTETAPAPASH